MPPGSTRSSKSRRNPGKLGNLRGCFASCYISLLQCGDERDGENSGSPSAQRDILFTHRGSQAARLKVWPEPDLEKPWHLKQGRSEEHTSELQSLMRISYAVFCLKKKRIHNSPT